MPSAQVMAWHQVVTNPLTIQVKYIATNDLHTKNNTETENHLSLFAA